LRDSGFFISFEGIDGSGKTKHIRALTLALVERGYEVVCYREPGGTELGDELRSILLDGHKNLSSQAETLLFLAARAQLVNERIQPDMDAGRVVILDRYIDSTIAYQGYGRGMNLESLATMTAFATQSLKPDLTLLLDVDLETAKLRSRPEVTHDRFESLGNEYYSRVRTGYLTLAQQEPERIVIVDTNREFTEVADDVLTVTLFRLTTPNI
jgi:dTMP kinase